MKPIFLLMLLFSTTNVNSHNYTSTFKVNDKCFKVLKKESHIKGNENKHGYLHKWEEYKPINCKKHIEESHKNMEIKKIKNFLVDKYQNLKAWLKEKNLNY